MKKRTTRILLIATLLGIFLAPSCRTKPDFELEKAAVAKVIDDSIGWFKTKDFKLLFETFSQGPDLFMYQLDTATTIRGFDEFLKYSEGWKNPEVKYGGHKIHELNVHLSRSGDTAWFDALLEDCAQVKDRPIRCFTTRVTGVLEKRDARWVIVHEHFSLPAEKIAEDWAARTAHPPTPGVSAR